MNDLFIKPLVNPESYRFQKVNCYGCGADSYDFYLKGEEDLTAKEGEFQYVKCHNCAMVYQNPRISPEQIKDFYDGEYIAHRKKKNWGVLTPLYEWAMNKHDREKDKIVAEHLNLNEKTEIMDVGCAVGTFLLHIHDKYGAQISGVDFKEGLDYPNFDKIEFYNGLFYEQDISAERYDCVSMWHYLEHCYDPNQSLQMAKKVLKKDGKLIVEVPRLDSFTFKLFGAKWPGVQAPQHTVLFDKKQFIAMMEKNGFRVVKYRAYGAFPPYFYIFAGTYFKLIGKGLNLNRIIFPYFLGQLLLTPFLLFQKYLNLSMQTVVCEKIED